MVSGDSYGSIFRFLSYLTIALTVSKFFINIAHLIFTILWDVNTLLYLFYRRGNRIPGDTTCQW